MQAKKKRDTAIRAEQAAAKEALEAEEAKTNPRTVDPVLEDDATEESSDLLKSKDEDIIF